ncbi:MAG: DUF4373 domain-containing protein [Bacteroides sp.]|nr:DUF4373 domain-containing protein [Bacteroides sp.]MCM1555772.1 DUF4373 domain-containing protein [Bacteroides sp.]
MNSYFSHDSNARNNEKVLAVRMRHGAEGYGVYFMLLERLRMESDYTSVKDYNMIAFDLRVSAELIKSVVENFGLFSFTEDGKRFYSEGFSKRMSIKDECTRKKAEAGRRGMERRWGGSIATLPEKDNDVITMLSKTDKDVITTLQISDNNKRKESKVKETDYVGKEKSPSSQPQEEKFFLKDPGRPDNKNPLDGQENGQPTQNGSDEPEKNSGGGAPDSVPQGRRIPFHENVRLCLEAQQWQEMVLMSLGIRELNWGKTFQDFYAHLIASGLEEEKSLRDFRQHFVNWMRVRLSEQQKQSRQNGNKQKKMVGNDRTGSRAGISRAEITPAAVVPGDRGVSVL